MKHYFELVENRIASSWNETILSDLGSESFTGKDIAENIAALHRLFTQLDIKQGSSIALCGKSASRWGIALLAVNTYGQVAVPILSGFRPEDIASLTAHSESQILFADKSIWDKVKPFAETMNLKAAVSLDDFDRLDVRDKRLEVRDESPAMPHFAAPKGDTLMVINYTSGTTSAPKGVMLTYDNFSTNLDYALAHVPTYKGDHIVSMLPLAHMFGCMFEFLYPFCGNVEICFLGAAPTPSRLLGAMKRVKPYIFITVPLVMEKMFKSAILPVVNRPVMKVMLRIPGISHIILSAIRRRFLAAFGGKVRHLIMGGAALNPDTERWLRRLRLPYTIGYGMTEAAPLLAYEDHRKFVPGSCGKAADRCEVRIDSADPEHVAGEIQARGMNIMVGYYKNEEATRAAFTEDGWLRTGDLGTIDAQGNIFIRGRLKNMLLSSNGQNIYPEEIEAIVTANIDCEECVVVQRGSRLVALVYRGDAALQQGAELALVNSLLPSYSKLSSIEEVAVPFEKTPKMSIKRFMYK